MTTTTTTVGAPHVCNHRSNPLPWPSSMVVKRLRSSSNFRTLEGREQDDGDGGVFKGVGRSPSVRVVSLSLGNKGWSFGGGRVARGNFK